MKAAHYEVSLQAATSSGFSSYYNGRVRSWMDGWFKQAHDFDQGDCTKSMVSWVSDLVKSRQVHEKKYFSLNTIA